ncbi:hypothetical protein BDW42DRAFT_5178 [Aspergillus taichungensis]|uniref:Uncharacterized protein n=1 Tax=Aspergillus taichungensis TaxID=482145 RepID=A0A2J5HKA9_9EURO|nr:hypothetical protein BDW42DRAFT_5178 [Aspergillus taichungensis]
MNQLGIKFCSQVMLMRCKTIRTEFPATTSGTVHPSQQIVQPAQPSQAKPSSMLTRLLGYGLTNTRMCMLYMYTANLQ